MPGFTHMQAAMVSSFGLWFAAYAESLCDDIQVLAGAAAFANASPLGTAAGYGTSLPIDRELTASLLKFERLIVASPYAQMSQWAHGTDNNFSNFLHSEHAEQVRLRCYTVHVARLFFCDPY